MDSGAVLALSGGVGGAKLCLGLAGMLPRDSLHVLVNTGDDFDHLGLRICPDIDTLLYTLSGRSNQRQGWGLEGETWQVMAALEELGGDTWFRLGDSDLATHLWRTQQLARGRRLTDVIAELAMRLGVTAAVYPMSDTPVHTTVHTSLGALPFQRYFVEQQCAPVVESFSFEGIGSARAPAPVDALLDSACLSAVVICPSNPYVSIDPILSVPGLWTALRDHPAPVVLVSPIVAGAALKGPAAKMMAELGLPVSAAAVARHYAGRYPGLLDHFVIDRRDATLAPEIEALGLKVTVTETVMSSLADKQRLAGDCLALEKS
jgi:LPPG:FO 2-phospho-L-lactate transferase